MAFDQRILVLGNETTDTDTKTSLLAQQDSTVNYGLIDHTDFVPNNPGYYHTTVNDISPGDIIHLSTSFDIVMMLDQPRESYAHIKSLITTVRLMYDLERLGRTVIYRDNAVAKNLIYWRNLLNENKSFCFYPFLALVDNTEYTNLCPKSANLPLTKLSNIKEWGTNPEYLDIREKMSRGELISKHCNDCYNREREGQESTRQYETLEWAEKIQAKSIEDFNVAAPLFYEIRPSNKCNIMCRTCNDFHSHLIEKEWKNIGIPLSSHNKYDYRDTSFDNIDFTAAQRIYVGGGEPTVMPEFYDFLRKCINQGTTNFELNIGTNGMKISDRLIDLLSHFRNVCFSFSYDGYQKVNDYIRWGSNFDTILENSRLLKKHGYVIALQSVFSMYSITRMHEVFEFYDKEYPDSGLLVQVATGMDDIFMPYNHPCPELVIESMRRCQKTKMYFQNGRSIKSMIDLLLDYYSNPTYRVNIPKLRKFFDYNDKLDASRGSQLSHYIPELEATRKFLTND